VLLALAAAALLVGAAVLLEVKGLSVAADITSLIGFVLAIVSVFLAKDKEPDPQPPNPEAALKKLRELVHSEWLAEIGARGLNDPAPLVVRWEPTNDPYLMDQEIHISADALLRFKGRTNEGDDLAREFKNLEERRQRLVLLSEPGMGKTTLAILMLRELSEQKDPAAPVPVPVPVFFSLSGWDPDEALLDWLTRRITETYPALRAAEYGPSAIKDLVNTPGRIVPILDGLDELPEAVRPRALKALNFDSENPLILTCRTKEYKEAVTSPTGRVLRGAVALEAQRLSSKDKAKYLKGCLQPDSLDKWSAWIEWLSTVPDANPIAVALATPLRLWLLRRAYLDTKLDPSELPTLGKPDEIQEHLLDRLVTEVIRESNEDLVRRRRKRRTERKKFRQFQARHTWNPDRAWYWLSYLAHYLDELPRKEADPVAHNLEWWQLWRSKSVSLRPIKTIVGLVAGAIFGFALGVLSEPAFGVLLIPICALVGGLLFLLGEEAEPLPRYANLHLRDRGRELFDQLWHSFRYTLLVGLISGLVLTLLVSLRLGLLVGLTFALVGGIAFTLSDSIANQSDTNDRPSTPHSTLYGDRAMTGVHILAVGTTITLTLGVAFGFLAGLAIGVAFAFVGGLGSSLNIPIPRRKDPIRIPFGFSEVGTAWANFIPTRIILATKRKTPLRLMSFLDDCYRLQLLKQEGARYQFRHAELQSRLAAVYSLSKRHK
jgi:hypothetical protein